MSENLKANKNGTEIQKGLKGCQRCSQCKYGLSIEDWQATPTVPSVNLMELLRLYSGLHSVTLTTVVTFKDCRETLTALFGPVSLSNPYNLINFTLDLYLMVL